MTKFELGESPLWHPVEGGWFWTDIVAARIYNASVVNLSTMVEYQDKSMIQMVSNIEAMGDSELLLSAESELGRFEFNSNKYTTILSLPHSQQFRCNDGSVGPDGKYWFGTMEKSPTGLNGKLYSFSPNGELVEQGAKIGIPNSFIWLDEETLLVSDSFLQKTFRLKLLPSGKLDWVNREVWLDLSDTDGTPDGGCIDSDGNVWLAIWGAAAIHKYSPESILLEVIELKALQPTSCAFGGAQMNQLMITTATEGLSPEQLTSYPDSGKVLLLDLGVKGKVVPKFKFKLEEEVC